MSLIKRWLEEREERGWDSIGKAICPDCLTNLALKALTEDNLEESVCDYCGRRGEAVACDTDVVMTRIGESFSTEYTDPVEELPYETAEGGYQGDWFNTHDLVWKIGEEIGGDAFLADLITAYGDKAWCERDYFISRPHDALVFSWERFAELVEYESRYLFLDHRGAEYLEPHEVEPADMLRKLGELVVEADLLRELGADTTFYRARPHGREVALEHATELGTAPREVAFSNRMSPAGIPLFYGAFDAETAAREAWEGPTAGKDLVTIGHFVSTMPLTVIDLASLPDVPSIFDEERRRLRSPLRFLREFSERISEPVRTEARSEREVVEYVPTQIVSEYFRAAFAVPGAGRPYGLLYRSALHEDGTSCALFLGRESCVDEAPALAVGAPLLVLEAVETWDALP